MNYDFHMYSVWRPFTGFNAPLHKEPFGELFLNCSHSLFLEQWFFGYVNSVRLNRLDVVNAYCIRNIRLSIG